MSFPLPSSPRNRSGFTLVEVTLAIAVALIGILGVLALLPQGMQSARSAADNTISATIVQNIFNQLHTGDFASNVVCRDVDCVNTPLTLDLRQQQNGTLYFDQSGLPTNGSSSSPTYYEVTLNCQPQSGNQNLSLVQAIVIWPGFAKIPPNTNIYTTAITWYDNL